MSQRPLDVPGGMPPGGNGSGNGNGQGPPPIGTCPPCQKFADKVNNLNAEITSLQELLHTVSSAGKPHVLKQIEEKNGELDAAQGELDQCEQENCPPVPQRTVTVTFTGNVTLVTDRANARGPFTRAIPTDKADCEMSTQNDPKAKTDLTFTFRGGRNASQSVGFVDFPTICQFVVLNDNPRITTILTVTLKDPMAVVGQIGPFILSGDGSSAEMQLPTVTLHLHSSFHLITDGDQDSDGTVTFTTGMAAQAGPFQPTGMHWDKSSGHVQLVGTTTLMGGGLDKTHAQFTLDGTLSPSPIE